MPTATGKYTITINVERSGVAYTDKDGNTSSSIAGHMWLLGTDAGGKSREAGFGPMDAKTGILPVAGTVYDSDASAYAGDPRYTKTFEVTKAQYDLFMAYASDSTIRNSAGQALLPLTCLAI